MLIISAAFLFAFQPSTRPPVTAFVHVTVVPMDRDRLLADHTVLVDNGRIAALGPADSVVVPPGAVIVDGRGRYLAPGLTDMHVHLTADIGARPNFGDAPLFLANGVTTVLNLRGDSTILRIRTQVADGRILGPTIYTSGEFVDEPRVNTPEEAEREVRSQAAAGYDVIKFREVVDMKRRMVLTTRGVSRETYHRLMAVARSIPIPVIGHTPNNLGLEAALAEGQSLAHAEATLVPSYFWPNETSWFKRFRAMTLASLVLLGGCAIVGWAMAIAGRRRGYRSAALAAAIATIAATGGGLWARELFSPAWLGNDRAVTGFTIGAAVLGLIGLGAIAGWVLGARDRATAPVSRWLTRLTAAFALVLATAALGYWTPLVRRGSPTGLHHLGEMVARAGVFVTPTLVVARFIDLATRPEVRYATPRSLEWWNPMLRRVTPERRAMAEEISGFLRRVIESFHRAGVPLLAGTDANGWAFMVPGFTLHQELALLQASGLSPFEALRTATTEPARFLRKSTEFGTVELDRRADLILLAGNPLADLATLRQPLGVMVRGRWLPAQALEAMVTPLGADSNR